MTAPLESTPQLDERNACAILAEQLSAIVQREKPGSVEAPYPGDAIAYLTEWETDTALRAALTSKEEDALEGTGTQIVMHCCEAAARAMFISLTEPPQRAIARISEIVQQLKESLRRIPDESPAE